MKKILFILLLSLLLFAVNSQAQVAMTNPNGLALDTVTNGTAEGPTMTLKGYQSTASFVVLITKISGTVAGTAELQGSNQVTKGYAVIDSSAIRTLSDATQSVVFKDVPKSFLYYRVLIKGTGTMSASYSGTSYVTKE